MDLPITYDDWKAWQRGDEHVQDRFPQLSDSQREFMISGVSPEEWATIPEEPDWDDEETESKLD